MVVSFLLMAVTAAMAKPCFTKEEARKQWPNERLYWHTERHCWDQIKRTSGTYEERQPEPTQQAANVVPAPLPKQVTLFADIRRDPPRLIFRQQLGCRSPARFILEIEQASCCRLASRTT
jgi:hypothetical protein